jgi:hemoglobin
MRYALTVLTVALGAWSWHSAASAQAAPSPSSAASAAVDNSLYLALGAKLGIGQLMEDFVPRLVADARIGVFFQKTNLAHLTEQLTEQLCMVSGGPCRYEGPSMKAVHADMDISKTDFNALVEVLQHSMEAKKIPFSIQNRLLARLAPMHRDIVNR